VNGCGWLKPHRWGPWSDALFTDKWDRMYQRRSCLRCNAVKIKALS
jgi:hypothetical protein